jgi:hypothetical protein
MDLLAVVALAVLLRSTALCIPHLRVSCIDHNSSRIGAIAHNSNHDNSSSNKSHSSNNNNNSIVPLPHRRSRLQSGHHNSFPPAALHASTAGRRATSLENATYPSKETRRELRHPW